MKDNLKTKKKLCDFFALLHTVFAFIAFGGGVAFSSLDNFFPFLTGLLLTAVFGHAAYSCISRSDSLKKDIELRDAPYRFVK